MFHTSVFSRENDFFYTELLQSSSLNSSIIVIYQFNHTCWINILSAGTTNASFSV